MGEAINIYMVPGLGFDHRIFENLQLDAVNVQYINWMEPKAKEKIEDYALRMSEKIKEEKGGIVLIGHSFGGIICQEIIKYKKVEKIILISSIRSELENPFHFKVIAPLFLHKLLRKSLFVNTVKFWGKYQGYETVQEQGLFKSMVSSYSDNYLQWAIHALSTWKMKRMETSTPIIQIHGKKDKAFPLRSIKRPDYVVEEGGHFMVYQQPGVLSQIIMKEIS